jgi:hypothetical protein
VEKLNTPDPNFECIRGSQTVNLLSREESLSILPHLKSTLFNGKGEWVKPDHRNVENHDKIEVSIKFEGCPDAL